ncbi:MAG: LysR family transcriptional regulator [Pseudomonadales bacterium]|nr:LysR family transcriptional regulator [Pseudomonadales bacterium]
MNWDHLEYFLAVARAGSLSGAAKQLDVNHSTVARRLEKLEQQLGSKLFHRLSNGYQLTEYGFKLQQQAVAVEDQINQIQRVFKSHDSELSGSLCVTKPSSGALNLQPIFADFLRQYPEIDLHIDAVSQFSDLSRLEADVAIRFVDTAPEGLVADKLGFMPMYIYGSSELIKQVNSQSPEDYPWVIHHGRNVQIDSEADLLARYPDTKIVMRTSSYNEVYEAICSGVGVGFLSPLRLPPSHTLQALAPERFSFGSNIWLLTHPDLLDNARVKVFKEFLLSRAAKLLVQQ